MALDRSLAGNQLFTVLLVVDDIGPSPIPKHNRMMNNDTKLNAAPVNPQKTDHMIINIPKIFFGPCISDKHPPTKLKSAYPKKKLLNSIPSSEGVRLKSFTKYGAATENAVRSM
jgi:hypothetical protein